MSSFSPRVGCATLTHLALMFGLVRCGRWSRRFVFHPADHGLAHDVSSVPFGFTGLGKAKFGTRDGAGHADWQVSTQIALDVCRFISLASRAPGIDAKHREVALLAFAAARSCYQILR